MDETELFSLWHSPLDNPGNIEEEKLQTALSICIEADQGDGGEELGGRKAVAVVQKRPG